MKATAERSDILAALEKCAHVSGSASGRPHAGKVRIKAGHSDGAGILTFYANDLSVSVDTVVLAVVDDEGMAATDTKRLHAVVLELPDGPISLALTPKGAQLSVSAKGHRKYALPTVDPDTFPAPPEPPEDDPRVTLPAARLAYLLSRVSHAMSLNDADQPHLQGVKLEVVDAVAFAVATDGKRFAKAETPVEGAEDMDTFVPRSMVRLILAEYEKEELSVGQFGATIFVETVDTLVCSQMPRSGFVPWRQLLDSMQPETAARVPRLPLLASIKAVLAARSKGGDIILRYAEPYDALEIQLAKEDADAVDRVEVTDAEPRPFELAYEPRYIIDAAKAADVNMIFRVVQSGGLSALVIETDEKFFAWVAPRTV